MNHDGFYPPSDAIFLDWLMPKWASRKWMQRRIQVEVPNEIGLGPQNQWCPPKEKQGTNK